METKFSKGYWKFDNSGIVDCIVGGNYQLIAAAYPCAAERLDEMVANGKLIAASPELLEACLIALEHHEIGEANSQSMGKPRLSEVVEKLRNAIQKATS